jgi:hypothetical protein
MDNSTTPPAVGERPPTPTRMRIMRRFVSVHVVFAALRYRLLKLDIDY